MSHTNSTTNYNLPQFLGTDKPAWLGDINPAFSAIDTAIKTASDNASTASTGTTANTTAIGDLSTLTTTSKTDLVSAINEVDSDLGTTATQVGTNTGDIGTLNTTVTNLSSDVATLKQILVMDDFSSGSVTGTNIQGNSITLAQNSDGSVFKIYGNVHGVNVNIPRQLIPGTARYGVPTGCTLKTAPSEAYQINCAGFAFIQNSSFALRQYMYPVHYVVGTDGKIYLWPENSNTALTSGSGDRLSIWLPCSIYFNTNFGDTD